MIELAPNRLIAFLRSRAADSIYQTSSSDGCNWTPPKATVLPNNNAAIQSFRLQDGNIVLAFNNAHDTIEAGKKVSALRKPLTVALSEDDGETWKYVRDVETGRPGFGLAERKVERPGREDACSLRGYNLMLYPHTSETGRITPAELRGSHFADGLIFMHTRMTSAQDIRETTIALQSEGKAFVMLNGPALTSDVCSVGVDDALLGQRGTEYLLSRNHQHIGVLAGSESSPSTPLFLKGIRKAMRLSKPSSPSLNIRFSEFSESRTAEAVNEWMQMEDRPTAIFCAYDQLVPVLYQELQRHKVRIPQKMAILGRGDLPLASYINPSLTTFHVPITEMGRIAANLLFDVINGKELLKQQRQVLLECPLVRRASA